MRGKSASVTAFVLTVILSFSIRVVQADTICDNVFEPVENDECFVLYSERVFGTSIFEEGILCVRNR